eukprot:373938_1
MSTLLTILDHRFTRQYINPSDIRQLFSPLLTVDRYKNDVFLEKPLERQSRMREIAKKSLVIMIKSSIGIFYLATIETGIIKTMIDLMKLSDKISGVQWSRKVMFDVLEDVLGLSNKGGTQVIHEPNLMVHHICVVLMAFIKNGLLWCLVDVGMRSNIDLAPRARALLVQLQNLSSKYLPPSLFSNNCSIPKVINDAMMFNTANNSESDNPSYKHKSKLEVALQRNWANMMVSELSEVDLRYDVADDSYDVNNHEDNDVVSPNLICHRLGPEFDLNSTFIRYRYMMDRDIPSLMFQDRIPYHHHRDTFGTDKHTYAHNFESFSFKSQKRSILESLKYNQNASYTETVILSMLKQTKVILTKDFMLWDMNAVWKVLNGPLWYVDNLQSAFKTKFIKRLLQYLKPSRQFFSQLKWSITTIRHAQCACQLFRLLISTDDGCKNQHFQELILELFECLKDQINANLKKRRPNLSHQPFSRSSIRYTLSRVYLILVGILSESERGINFFQQHHMLAFLFPLTRKEITDHDMDKNRIVGPNDYLLRLIATNLDYAVSDDFRMLYPQWMSSGSYYLRKCLITHLELLYRAQMPKFDEWSINVLAVILKDKEQRLALTALKVLEKINLSQHSIKSSQYLIDLIYTQPTDSIIGIYGQFLFIKMLSTKQGFEFLKSTGWLNKKRESWSNLFHQRYTNMLETALVHSVSSTATLHQEKDKQNSDMDENKTTETSVSNSNSNSKHEELEWLPYHLVHENRSDEDELYHEYLTQFPWSITIKIVRASGQEIEVSTDTFFDYNCFYYKNDNKSPISLGPGIHGIILDKTGCSKPLSIDKNSRIKLILNIGHETLDDLYNLKSLSKTVSMIESKQYKTCSIIHEDQTYFFFEPHQHLSRVFFSLKEIQKSHSLVRPLPHFYGELCKTKDGCQHINKNKSFKNDIEKFINNVHNAYKNMNNPNILNNNSDNNLELRSCLWAIGMIGSSINGLNLLLQFKNDESININIIDDICILTQESPTLSI